MIEQEYNPQVDIDNLRAEVERLTTDLNILRRTANANTMVINVLTYFGQSVLENIDAEVEREAMNNVLANVNIDRWWALDILSERGVSLRSSHEVEYNVTVTIPVYFTMSITAQDEEDARDRANDEVGGMWLSDIIDNFSCDFDGSEIVINDVEEV